MSTAHNADIAELDKFGEIAQRWWDPNSEFRPLHDINPARLEWITRNASLPGARVVDVGCGGGILSEGLAAAGATVTGIDLGEKALEVARLHKQGYEIIMIGHRGHPEVEGTMGQGTGRMHLVENVDDVARLQAGAGGVAPLAYVTQTTLSVDDARTIVHALTARFPGIVGPRKDDICYATQNRQDAVKSMTGKVDLVLVVGSRNSSNSNRLREVAALDGIPAHLIDGAEQIDPQWLAGRSRIGLTAGASAPEVLVEGVIERLRELGAANVELLPGASEDVNFPLPRALAE